MMWLIVAIGVTKFKVSQLNKKIIDNLVIRAAKFTHTRSVSGVNEQ